MAYLLIIFGVVAGAYIMNYGFPTFTDNGRNGWSQ